MSAFPVSLEKEVQLTQRMAALGVREADLEETFVRSGGHGGQNVNKTSTCVMSLHRPHRPAGQMPGHPAAGPQPLSSPAACCSTRLKRAKRVMWTPNAPRIEKIRRQKRKRSRRAKARMLADKSRHADKKAARRPVGME